MNFINGISAIVLLGSVQGFFLMGVLLRNQQRKYLANRWLAVFIGLLSLTLLGKLIYHPALFRSYPQWTFLSDVIIYLYGPFLFLYIRQLLHPNQAFIRSKNVQHFIPAFIHTFTIIPQMLVSKVQYHTLLRTPQSWIYTLWAVLGLGAILHNLLYLWKSHRLLYHYQSSPTNQASHQTRLRFLHLLISLVTICILSWLTATILLALKVHHWLLAYSYNLIWIIVAGLTYVLAYYVMTQSKWFVSPSLEVPSSKSLKYASSPLDPEEVSQLKHQLETLMQSKKPYLDAQLTKPALAKMLHTNTTALSRVINESFGINFFHFINQYRIAEFIQLAQQKEYQHYTYLALAYEVGFNSKSTFNKAFKKIHHTTPRSYFKNTSPQAQKMTHS